ncbi:MAG: hypothetical protein CME32_01215 [Gimesia sp.]|nr:hypothetical protein [Gimesia sp.]
MSQWQIETPAGHAGVLLFIIAFVYLLVKVPLFQSTFKFLPPLILIFLLPASLATLEILPAHSAFYVFSTKVILPASMTIYLLSTDFRLLRGMGKESFIAVTSGALSLVVVGVVSYLMFRSYLGNECWKQIAPLVGGWIGGYSTMIVAKESVGCTDENFAPILILASLLSYSWMAGLVNCARFQSKLDRWINVREPAGKVVFSEVDNSSGAHIPLSKTMLAIWLAIAIAGSQAIMYLGTKMPVSPPVLTSTTWGFVLLLLICMGLGLSQAVQNIFTEAIPFGNMGLMIVVACLGAQCSLKAIIETPYLFLMATFLLMGHSVLMLLTAYHFRIRTFIVATASQANIGGAISAPIVAAAYKPGSESLGFIMSIYAARLGIPLSLLTAQLMQWLG